MPTPTSHPTYDGTLEPIVATGITKTYPAQLQPRPVLDGIDLTVAPGVRVGLIGENGSGKSTLLRILGGAEVADSGQLLMPRDVAYLAQDIEHRSDGTVSDLLEQTLLPLRRAVLELEQLGADLAAGSDVANRYDLVLSWATQHDAWNADARAARASAAFGVGSFEADRPLATLSGGQRMRLALATTLVRQPVCLLLDEPTNYLDDSGLELLEQMLVELPGVVVLASHDRVFLDRVCTELYDLDAGALGTDGRGGRRFSGTVSEYLEHQRASRLRWEETYLSQQEELDRLRDLTRIGTGAIAAGRGPRDNDKFITKFKGANVERAHARRVNDAQRRLEVAEREQVRKPPAPLSFSGRLTSRAVGALAVSIRDLVVTSEIAGRPRLAIDRLDVPAGAQLLVTGPNGSGKSTLLSVIAGKVGYSGSCQLDARRLRLLAQEPELGDLNRSAVDAYEDAVGAERAEQVPLRSLGLLHPRQHAVRLDRLSGGQRQRLALAIAVAAAPDLLLLDEPTNHLSLALVAELEEALASAAGTVIVASHDRWLRRRWSGASFDLATGALG